MIFWQPRPGQEKLAEVQTLGFSVVANLSQIDSLRMSSPVPFELLGLKLLKDPDWEYIPD